MSGLAHAPLPKSDFPSTVVLPEPEPHPGRFIHSIRSRIRARAVVGQIFGMLCSSWVLVASMPCGSARLDGKDLAASLLGRIVGEPGDGVQVWVNPMHIDVENEFGFSGDPVCSSVPYAWPPIPMPM